MIVSWLRPAAFLIYHVRQPSSKFLRIASWRFIEEGARTVADRVEQFAIEAKLGGRPNIGTISTTVVPTEKGRWNVKFYYLSPSAKRGWPSVSEDDWEAGDDWKEP